MIDVLNISKRYGSKILFDEASARLDLKSRTALVGPNGAGKSTLVKMLLGLEDYDSGQIQRAKQMSLGHLSQDLPRFEAKTVLEETLRLDGRLEKLNLLKNDYEADFQKRDPTEDELAHYGRILSELENLDEYRLEARAKTILDGIGFAGEDIHKPLSALSGGWLMRVALARLLLMDPDLLLLDEPTNHLDLETLLWLENFLLKYQGALLLISHDTAFLNRMVNQVLEIDQRKLWTYTGNLDSYVQQKQIRLEQLQSQYEGQQAKIAEIKEFVARFGAKASKARQAQSRLKQLDRMDIIELAETRAKVRFRFPPTIASGKDVLGLSKVSLSYPGKKIFDSLDLMIPRSKRMAIVGVNGAGKSSLLKILAGAMEPSSGEIKLGHNVKVGYYAQHQVEALDLNKTVLEQLQAVSPESSIAQIRSIAGAFLFSGDSAEKKCKVLSGGEKARVALAGLLLTPINFLLLDEPTNHLDVESRGVLLEALEGFEGTLCLISHDRQFVSPLVDSVLEITPGPSGSKVEALIYDYEEYLERKMRELESKPIAPSSQQSSPQKKSTVSIAAVESPVARPKASPNQLRSWQRDREKVEQDISQLETRQAELSSLLADPATYADNSKFFPLMEEQTLIQQKLEEKMAKWESLVAQIESN